VKTTSGNPEANGKIERRHKELGMICRLYECQPPAAAVDDSTSHFAQKKEPKASDILWKDVWCKNSTEFLLFLASTWRLITPSMCP